jgi:L-idonate 5-dehydrogenase
MKAIVIHGPRDLRIESLAPAPKPGPGEVRLRVAHGGICGSDLHYYLHGGFGAIRIQEPMALGYEVSGVINAVGDGVEGLSPGDKGAVTPSRPCARCDYCLRGQPNQCLDMRFNGSAMRMPHEQGLFREELTVPATLVERFAPEAELAFAAMTEPLAVCLHAVRRAGSLVGKTVLVAGSGPIGCLTIAAARLAGAARIVATDISDTPLGVAAAMGADETINLASTPEGLAPFLCDKGRIDVSFECSGAAPSLGTLLNATRAGGTVILVGMGGDAPLPLQLTVAKELTLRGAFRFHEEFAAAARLISEARIDLAPLLTGVLDADDAVAAFDLAANKSRAMKVQIRFPQA